jgi:hypothetical protein
MCGETRPLALDGAFFHKALRTMSDPYSPDEMTRPNAPESAELSGDELMVWAKKSA